MSEALENKEHLHVFCLSEVSQSFKAAQLSFSCLQTPILSIVFSMQDNTVHYCEMRIEKGIHCSISFRTLHQFVLIFSLEIHDIGKPLEKWKDFTHRKLILSPLLFQTLYYVPGSIDFLFIFTLLE